MPKDSTVTLAQPTLLKQDTISFETQGRLLQELGERLVTNAEVALMELIKNAYDADAVSCRVLHDGDKIMIIDDGHGISPEDFRFRWMRIATGGKVEDKTSPQFKRPLTGAKGIGRFAVRYLGRYLELTSVTQKANGDKILLKAAFDWEKIDKAIEMDKTRIPFAIYRVPPHTEIGTTLTISKLRQKNEQLFSKKLRNQLLGIISPNDGLERGHLTDPSVGKKGSEFNLVLPSGSEDVNEVNFAKDLLGKFYARLVISHREDEVTFVIQHKDGRELVNESFHYPSKLSFGLHADIRFFPKRRGMFEKTTFGGRESWNWVRQNKGVAVIDHGFRISPYGGEDDDWLMLAVDAGHNRREWRSALMQTRYPIGDSNEDSELSMEKQNAMLYLPAAHQLIGAVTIRSVPPVKSGEANDLTPASDREGFLKNQAFDDMVMIVRTGLELLAYADHRENRRLESIKAKEEADSMRKDFSSAIKYIQDLQTLTSEDKDRISREYKTLVKKLENVEDYNRQANEKMDTMSMLGVLAGFMTHESRRMISEMDEIFEYLQLLAKNDKKINEKLRRLNPIFEEFKGQVEYGSAFINAAQNSHGTYGAVPVQAQVEMVTDRFKNFCDSRKIRVAFDGEEGLAGPRIPPMLYSGALLNLFTNSLKAVVNRPAGNKPPCIAIKAWNESGKHFLEVVDNGIGIPEDLRKRIWDPLFTTTSVGTMNPLGSGMGLGLTLVKMTIERARGKIGLVPPPAGFSTCFRIQFPLTRA